jgi:O-antigen/teichoic acid export membrane protein
MKGQSLRQGVFHVGVANTIGYALGLLLPVVVVRALSIDDFADYRMVWLVVGTLMAFATLHIPGSLSYFLPRLKDIERIDYIVSALYILAMLALIASTLVNPWYPLLPGEWSQINGPVWFYSVFIFLWVIASLIDGLPIADGRATWQAGTILVLSITRVVSVSLVAWVIGTLEAVLLMLLIFSLFKTSLLVYYINKFHGWSFGKYPRSTIKKELAYSWPFGVASGFYIMRHHAELWLVAALFGAREFASFSLGLMVAPLFGIIRKSVNNVVFPTLSSLESKQNIEGLADLNRKATSTVAYVLVPVASLLWVFADEVITIIFTSTYSQAANVMRIYLLGVIPQLFESSTLLRVTGMGSTALKIDILMLPLVVAFSYIGIQLMGLPGGAIGSVAALYLSHFIAVFKGANRLGASVTKLYDFRRLLLMIIIGVLSALLGRHIAMAGGIKVDILIVVVGGTMTMLSYLAITIISKVIPEPVLQMIKR